MVLDELEGGGLVQSVDSEDVEPVLLRGDIQPRGGNEAQPVRGAAAGQGGELRGTEQGGIGDVIEEDEAGRSLIGIVVAHGDGPLLQMLQDAAPQQVGIVFLRLGRSEADGTLPRELAK